MSTPVVGRPVTLRCKSQSNSVPVNHSLAMCYSWKINNTAIEPSSKYIINNSMLTIPPVQITDTYNLFMCIANEEEGLSS